MVLPQQNPITIRHRSYPDNIEVNSHNRSFQDMPHNLHDLQSLPLPDAYTLACCKVEIPFPTENPQNREDLRDGYNIPLFLSSPMNFQHPLTENNTDCHFPNQS